MKAFGDAKLRCRILGHKLRVYVSGEYFCIYRCARCGHWST